LFEPDPPWQASFPAPPSRTSFPPPPISRSFPPSPKSLSGPPRPDRTFLAPSPLSRSPYGDPVRFSIEMRVSVPSPVAIWSSGWPGWRARRKRSSRYRSHPPRGCNRCHPCPGSRQKSTWRTRETDPACLFRTWSVLIRRTMTNRTHRRRGSTTDEPAESGAGAALLRLRDGPELLAGGGGLSRSVLLDPCSHGPIRPRGIPPS
jgi:hypothetical protein